MNDGEQEVWGKKCENCMAQTVTVLEVQELENKYRKAETDESQRVAFDQTSKVLSDLDRHRRVSTENTQAKPTVVGLHTRTRRREWDTGRSTQI